MIISLALRPRVGFDLPHNLPPIMLILGLHSPKFNVHLPEVLLYVCNSSFSLSSSLLRAIQSFIQDPFRLWWSLIRCKWSNQLILRDLTNLKLLVRCRMDSISYKRIVFLYIYINWRYNEKILTSVKLIL